MSSGYFPLNRYDEHYRTLTQAAELLEAVVEAYAEGEDLEPADALEHGVYLGYLGMAMELIRRTVRQ